MIVVLYVCVIPRIINYAVSREDGYSTIFFACE